MFRFLDNEQGPYSFWRLPWDERSRRLRYYLICIASGSDELSSWMAVMDFTEETIQDTHYLIDVENRDDRRIEGLIERGARAHRPDRLDV